MSLFRKKNSNKLGNTSLVAKNENIAKPSPTLRVHGDLKDLLWIADGPKKNYTPERDRVTKVDLGYYTISLSFSSVQEPSLISTKEAVDMTPLYVEKLPYYPSYSEMSPEQRGTYWKFLENPYDPSYEIGYVFVLYYGLERHLLLGNYENAIDVIIKLRDSHNNASFQSYSANAIILTCLKNKRADLLYKFLSSLDKDYEFNFSHNLFIFSKYSLELPLNADDVIRMARSFEFTKVSYIRDYPDLFKQILTQNMTAVFGKPEVLCSQLIKKTDYKKLPKETLAIFSNMSIMDKTIDVPLMVHAFQFKRTIYDLLNQTHEELKTYLAKMRKSGEAPPKASATKKEIKIESFDKQKEKELLEKYNSCVPGSVKEHYVSIELQDFYYRYRNIDDAYLKECIKFCNDDITKLQSINNDYLANEKEAILRSAEILKKSKVEVEKELANISLFSYVIPAFKRLAIIYEKNKEYEKALSVCDSAIKYYSIVKNKEEETDFIDRKEKLMNKQGK